MPRYCATIYLELAEQQYARRGRRISRARFKSLSRRARASWSQAAFGHLNPMRTRIAQVVDAFRPSDYSALRRLNAMQINWAAYSRKLGYLDQARDAIRWARKERLEAEAIRYLP